MPTTFTTLRWLACAAALALPACGGGGGSPGDVSPDGSAATGVSSAAGYAVTNLVSDTPAASPYVGTHTHAQLVNAWGVAFNPQGFVWVANAGTSTSTLYDGDGVPQSLVVAIPGGSAGTGRPTGIVFNTQQDFRVTQNGISGASPFIFAGEAGTISGWSPAVNGTNAVTAVDDGASGAVYTGLAIGSASGHVLYATDFRNATVNQFDGNFTRIGAPGAFRNPTLPAGYAPYGVQAIGERIYVAYARQDPQTRKAVAGAGLGVVDVFDTTGNMIQRLVPAGDRLDAPWGMAMAPADFGPFSNALLVGNAGDGKINAFNLTTGAWMGALSATDGTPITIDGLHGIAFGNGLNRQPANTLFFAAGPAGGTHGAYGRIDSKNP